MTKQLMEAGMSDRYERFPAVDGRTLGAEYTTKLDRGALGLWLTHERLLSANQSSRAHLHVLEDDTVLPKDAGTCFADLLANVETECADWDVILTEMHVDMSFSMFRLLTKWKEEYQQGGKLRMLPVKSYPSAGATSLFINAKSIGKYLRMIEGRWTEGAPIDLFLRTQINRGSLNAYVTMPFATTLPDSSMESDIRGGLDLSRRVLIEYRRAWFKDADPNQLAREMRRLTATAKITSLSECYLQAAKFVLSDQWMEF